MIEQYHDSLRRVYSIIVAKISEIDSNSILQMTFKTLNDFADLNDLIFTLLIVRMMILKQSKRRRTLFRKRKFDILIRSDLAKSLSTKNVLYYIDKISFSYLFV